ncbi:MAG: hypothetical protein H7Y38_19545 [Armatimonadetes bacterium]|nr:hypothetical protein [Armatimonadota bacterium]
MKTWVETHVCVILQNNSLPEQCFFHVVSMGRFLSAETSAARGTRA